ncbi:MAG: DEAD/DEAH box helicase [Armatimonadota bacterium]|nr:DEAD/DEAH box helicase [Armatimonadota bacterium]
MDVRQFLANIQSSYFYRDQVAHIESIPARDAQYADLSKPLPPPVAHTLQQMGIERLYTHQATAIEKARAGRNVVIVTSTASGKTLCYNLPVIETLLRDPSAKAFYLFPTKALAQDQVKTLRRMAELNGELAATLKVGTYDGDTPQAARRKLRDEGSIILTNPDMLHQGILPYHSRWNRVFGNLKYVIVDEIHTYRGIFGSNVANVLRRLRRICNHYGSDPVFICSSATIANPLELAERLTGLPMELVENDGSPKGPKQFVMWNPPFIDVTSVERLSSNVEAQRLMVELIRQRVQTICFGRARIVAELLYKYVREDLERYSPALANSVRAYRGGYLPEERREIERKLFSGELLGVTSTNALELGIDVGSLDASIIIGFPGTIASTWQQAGRAGRGADESVVFFIAYNDPIDQYLMRHPDYFMSQSPEHAIIDPKNAYILANHLRCAAFELPIRDADAAWFGDSMSTVCEILGEFGQTQKINDAWYWANTEFPAAGVNLRTMSDHTYTIVDTTPTPIPKPPGHENTVIGSVDAISAPELVYPEAIYMHDAETYFVQKLDLDNKVAYVRKADVDYYTQAILDAGIRVIKTIDERKWGQGLPERSKKNTLFFGDVNVTWATTAFKKIKFYSLDSIGWGKVDLPAQNLETTALWLVPPKTMLKKVRDFGRNAVEGLVGIRNVAVHVLPLFAMCDKQDIGGIVDSSNTGSPTIFLYDRFPGGLGYAEKGFEMIDELMESCLKLIHECNCDDGCPSCVGIPLLRPPIHTDPDTLGGAPPIPDKEAALVILHELLGKEPYVPKPRVEEPPAEPVVIPEPIQQSNPIPMTTVAERIRARLRESKG